MKKIFHCLLPVIFFTIQNSSAQTDTLKPVKVAVFIPVYTDSVYDGFSYTSGKGNLPKNVLQGLEFYNGVMMAIDSLNNEGTYADFQIYDTKDPKPLISILSDTAMSGVGLIVAAITNTQELKTFSEYSLAQNIPLISATYPNYVGLKENPYFVLLNSSFEAHLQGLQKYMQKNYSADTIIAVTRKGGQYEAFIKKYITTLNRSAASIPLKFKWVAMDERNINISDLHLDTLKRNIVFVASPMERFGLDVVKAISSVEQYKAIAIGMPTWDNVKELDRSSCRNVEIVFSTPFVYTKNKALNASLTSRYKEKFFSRPSDMVFKGYEIVFHFTKLLVKQKNNLVNHLSDKDFTIFHEFKLEPVRLNKTSVKPDFIENKRLYFIRKQQGSVKSIS